MRQVALRSPGKSDDDEIVVRALLVNTVEVIPQLAVRKKEAQPLAVITVAILVQNLIHIHSTLLESGQGLRNPPKTLYPCAAMWIKHHNDA